MNPNIVCSLITCLVLAATLPTGAALAQLGRQQGLLDPNVAGEQELQALPQLDAALVKGILERRPFLSATELDGFLASSLSKERRAELYRKLWVHINLNAAAREEILLIPGMGDRMVGEFLEYRPYRSLAQFRKEIGKYVGEEEVARLEQYVFVPINLNTAGDEDLKSIPGLGPRMLREFKEYRPYKSMAQFRKEIGKYVNEKEVARLERYVTIE
jgi:DNA uptake protein ComE-like DNA-binding protein